MAKAKKPKKKKPTKAKIDSKNLILNALIDLFVGTLLILINKLFSD